ncbi:hypothetical protein PbJCM13498_32650 [Prolixibacter bellariivorans]|uniref:Beta-lactamase-inhibitor-like PepSY-like domain-containing protein n=1 Tax=Prolixibacter bellariivorans TaxID=314319 RepID=A0A5M4B2Q7_9BACT|nr:hypothetical protein [Prolixibacter bellariivorans]GET34402.1 hypothetical protein PbJCM13498_32650 [Prolixibacter bellariivorans]
MKKLFFTVAILFSMATIYAVNANPVDTEMQGTTITWQQPDFTQIGVSSLPQAIREAVSDQFKDATITGAFVANLNDGTKLYKVILNVEGHEKSVMFNEDGSRYQIN